MKQKAKKSTQEYTPLYILGGVMLISIIAMIVAFSGTAKPATYEIEYTGAGQAVKGTTALSANDIKSDAAFSCDGDPVCEMNVGQAQEFVVLTEYGNVIFSVYQGEGISFGDQAYFYDDVIVEASEVRFEPNTFFDVYGETNHYDQVFFKDEARFMEDQVVFEEGVEIQVQDAIQANGLNAAYACFSESGVLYASPTPCVEE